MFGFKKKNDYAVWNGRTYNLEDEKDAIEMMGILEGYYDVHFVDGCSFKTDMGLVEYLVKNYKNFVLKCLSHEDKIYDCYVPKSDDKKLNSRVIAKLCNYIEDNGGTINNIYGRNEDNITYQINYRAKNRLITDEIVDDIIHISTDNVSVLDDVLEDIFA